MRKCFKFVFGSVVLQNFVNCLKKSHNDDRNTTHWGVILSRHFNASLIDLLEGLLVLTVDREVCAGHILQEEVVLLLSLGLVETCIGLVFEPTSALWSACRRMLCMRFTSHYSSQSTLQRHFSWAIIRHLHVPIFCHAALTRRVCSVTLSCVIHASSRDILKRCGAVRCRGMLKWSGV